MLTQLTDLRSHLESCRILVTTLQSEQLSDITEYIHNIQDSINKAVMNTNKSIIAVKNMNNIQIEPAIVKPAEKPLKNVDTSELETFQKEYEEEQLHVEKQIQERESRKLIQYHPDPKLHKIVKLHEEMDGISLTKLIKPFTITRPAIELCEVLEFMKSLFDLRQKNKLYVESAIYINLCEYSTLYVGLAYTTFRGITFSSYFDAIQSRLHEHRNWPSNIIKANWTALYKVKTLLSYFPGDKEDENLLTLLLVKCLDSSNVRGGIYTDLGLIKFPQLSVEEIKNKLLERSK